MASTATKTEAGLFAILIALALTFAGGAWILMLLLGVCGHVFGVPKMAIGFWPCLGLSALLNLAIGFFKH